MSLINKIKQGERYTKLWLIDNHKINAIFKDGRIIKSVLFAQKIMPFMAIFVIFWQYYFFKLDFIKLSIAATLAIIFILTPIYALYWLGNRAESKLDGATAGVFWQIWEKLDKQGIRPILSARNLVKTDSYQPNYLDLAIILDKCNTNFSADFFDDF